MFLDRTREQQALADACRQMLIRAWPIERVVHAMAETALPAGPWGAASEMGWLHVMSPEPAGALGLTAVEAGAVSEEAGRGLFPGHWPRRSPSERPVWPIPRPPPWRRSPRPRRSQPQAH